MTRIDEPVNGWLPVGSCVPDDWPQSSIWSNLTRYPEAVLALLCLTQILCWSVVPALVNIAPPNDVVEGFMWGANGCF